MFSRLAQDTFSLIVCNLPVVVTFGMRKLGRPEDETDHTNASTFGWRVATRKTGMTASTNSDTAVTTVNLRDFRTNTVITNPTLTQIERERDYTRTVDMSETPLADNGPRPQKSIVWITPDKMHRHDSRDEDEEAK